MDNALKRIDEARDRILAQIIERDRDFAGHNAHWPWSKVLGAQSFVFNLPADDLCRIRLHSDAFTGLLTARYLLNFPLMDAERFAKDSGYLFFGEGVPEQFWADEPQLPGRPDLPLGVLYKSRILNDIAVLDQQNVCNHWRLGAAAMRQPVFVEIGAGYGAFALSMLRMLQQPQFVIIDLPEMLIYSASHLLAHRPDLDAYVYAPGDSPTAMSGRSLVFLPNYRGDWLSALPRIDIAHNSVSLPEIRPDHARDYCRRIADRLDGYFYSINYQFNKQGGPETDRLLADYFSFALDPQIYRRDLELTDEQYAHHLCRLPVIGVAGEDQRAAFAGRKLRFSHEGRLAHAELGAQGSARWAT